MQGKECCRNFAASKTKTGAQGHRKATDNNKSLNTHTIMKTLRTILAALAILGGALTMNAQRMSYEAMSSNARFLTDRMAYTLGITAMDIIDDIYRINFDYIYGVNDYLDDVAMGYYYDDYMAVCARRDYALRTLLGDLMWNRIVGYNYFHRPIVFSNRRWHFGIYDYDRFGAHYYHYSAPRYYHNHYAGGHFFGGMPARPGYAGRPVVSGHVGDHRPVGHPQGNMGHPGYHIGNMNNGARPQGNMNNGRPQGNVNVGRPQGNVNNGGMNNNRPQGNVNNGGNYNRPQGNTNAGRPQGSMNGGSRSSGNMNSSSRQGTRSAGEGSRGAGSGRR